MSAEIPGPLIVQDNSLNDWWRVWTSSSRFHFHWVRQYADDTQIYLTLWEKMNRRNSLEPPAVIVFPMSLHSNYWSWSHQSSFQISTLVFLVQNDFRNYCCFWFRNHWMVQGQTTWLISGLLDHVGEVFSLFPQSRLNSGQEHWVVMNVRSAPSVRSSKSGLKPFLLLAAFY